MATSNCIDVTDQITMNKLGLAAGVNSNDKGEYTLNQIDVFAQQLIENMESDKEDNPIGILYNQYGDDLYKASDYINSLQSTLTNSDYPSLDRRWASGNITLIEFADFTRVYNYTPTGVLNSDLTKLARSLDSYYADTFDQSGLGGFCALMPQIFGQIDAFFNLVGQIDAAISDTLETIRKIRSYKFFAKEAEKKLVKQLIEELKKKVEDVIDDIIQEVQDALENFSITDIIGDIETFYNKNIAKPVMTAKEQACAFFTKENKKTFKEKILALIDYAVSLFESPNLEAIQMMIARFCALVSNMEALVRDIKKPLDDYTLRFTTITNRLKTISNINTSTAIRAGAIRYSPAVRKDKINRLEARWTDPGGGNFTPSGNAPTNVPEPTAAEYGDLPPCGQVFSGANDKIKLEGDWMDEKEGVGIYGYTRIDLDVKVYLMRVHKELGGTFTINYGWTSKAYNKKMKGNENNAHLSGLVVDIKKDMPDVEAFIASALKNGFKFAKEYDKSIHLDIREIPGQ